MEAKYIDHIIRNLVELCTTTICQPRLVDRLMAENKLSLIEKQSLGLIHLTAYEKSSKLYEILVTRSDSYHQLMLALKETDQPKPLDILVQQCCPIVQKIFPRGDLNAEDESGDNALFAALNSEGKLSDIEEIIKLGVNPKNTNKHGQSVLHRATEKGNLDVIKHFVLLGVDIISRDNKGNTVLHSIAKTRNNFVETLNYLLGKELDINSVNNNGENLLLLAAALGRTKEELEIITNFGGSWKQKDNEGNSVLHWTASRGNVEAMKYFISLGADIYWMTKLKATVLYFAALAPTNFVNTLEFLLEKNLDINAVTTNGVNLVLLAAYSGRSKVELETIVNRGGEWRKKNIYGFSVLHYAAQGGNVEALKYFNSLGAEVTWKGNDGQTVLHMVAYMKQNFNPTLEFLLEKNLDINAVDKNGLNLLFMAVGLGRSKEDIQTIIRNGGNWQHKCNFGQSILHQSARYGNVEALKYFTLLGADINCKDNCERTVLHLATWAGKNFKETLDFLLENNLDINAVDKYGNNLVLLAATYGRSKEVIESVVNLSGKENRSISCPYHLIGAAAGVDKQARKINISFGTDINYMQNDEMGLSHMVASATEQFKQVLKILVEKNLDINAVNNNGDNLVSLAAQGGWPTTAIESVVSCGGQWKHKNNVGGSVLHVAASGGNVEALKYFISLGADINCTNNDGRSVLHMVCQTKQNFKESLEYLLLQNLDINTVDSSGDNLITLAAFHGRSTDELESIVDFGGDWKRKNNFGRSVLHYAAAGGNVEAMKYFISLGADINCTDNVGRTVLHMVAQTEKNFKETLEYLLQQNLDINAVNNSGENLIALAAFHGRSKDELESIVDFRGDWKHKNNLGRSVLHLAAQGGNVEAIKYFISLGESINCKDNENTTVLQMVVSAYNKNFKQTLEFLLEKNLHINAVNQYGNSLLSLAKAWGRSEMEIELIKQLGGK